MRYFYLLSISLFLCACGSDASVEAPTAEPKMPPIIEEVQAPSTEDKILFGGTWLMTDIEGVEGAEHFLKDALKQYKSCSWDFQPEGVFEMRMGDRKAQGKWILDEAKKTIITKIGRSETKYDIRELSDNALRLYLPTIQNELIFERK